jgi:hypothetical protein
LMTPHPIRPGGQMRLTSIITKESDDNDNNDDDEVWYHNLFPLRQLFLPAVEYPLWDENWDERHSIHLSNDHPEEEHVDQYKKYMRQLRKNGVTRHIILIRHGQYDETHKVCIYVCMYLLVNDDFFFDAFFHRLAFLVTLVVVTSFSSSHIQPNTIHCHPPIISHIGGRN